jgi:hypothetical protein
MTGMMYEVKITAVGEVRDAEGNLVEQIPIETTQIVSETELREMQGASE